MNPLILIIIITITIILLLKIYKFVFNYYKNLKKINNIPGIPVNPWLFFLGNFTFSQFKKYDLETIQRYYFQVLNGWTKLFQNTFRIWLTAFQPLIIVHRVDCAEKILSNNDIFLDKDYRYRLMKSWLNEGLLTSLSNKWRFRRKLLTPTFHFNILEQFIPIMNEQAIILTKIIEEKINDEKNFLNIVPLITNATLDVISETAMGVKIESQFGKNRYYVDAISRISETLIKRMIFPWLQNDFIFYNFFNEGRTNRNDIRMVHNLTMNIIQERKKFMINQKNQNDDYDDEINNNYDKKRRLTFMDLLIEQHLKNPKQFTELDIREEVDTFMFEGHDTTAMSLIWTLHLLGNHPDIQERVHKEIDKIRSDNEDNDVIEWNQNQLRQMKFLEACIKESLRLYPSVPMISRQTYEEIEIEQNCIIPKNYSVIILLYAIQRDPKYFQQPERFIPDRFITESKYYSGHINPFAFVPFSAGPRNCIGQKFALQEEKIILATLLSKYRIESGDNLGDVDMNASLILRPRSTVNIRFIKCH